ncbi:hypothetical protein SAMN04489716_3782 [Actinoplanes derwentensis]|uniref:Uncharacterized protein n=1 Tax=Actinoplanes derwentensis TaxID=113562 RepID=A0A1H2ACD0_9ACTN|nr:hypothetical protein SAMN04489716_3782 [Actinoplanes derwentensis]
MITESAVPAPTATGVPAADSGFPAYHVMSRCRYG